VVELIGILSRLLVVSRGFAGSTEPGSVAAVRALHTGGPLYAGNTLYIDSPAHHLSAWAQNLRDGFAVLTPGLLLDARNARAAVARPPFEI